MQGQWDLESFLCCCRARSFRNVRSHRSQYAIGRWKSEAERRTISRGPWGLGLSVNLWLGPLMVSQQGPWINGRRWVKWMKRLGVYHGGVEVSLRRVAIIELVTAHVRLSNSLPRVSYPASHRGTIPDLQTLKAFAIPAARMSPQDVRPMMI